MKKKVEKLTIKNVKWLVFIFLVLFTGAVWGQVTINSVIAQSPVHFAENSDFSAGELTITFNMPAGQTTGELKVNLATGIEYLPGSVTATGATIVLKSGSTNANKPEFTLTGASGTVNVKLKRKVTKAVLTNAALASGLFDEAILTVGGVSTNPAAKNATGYLLPRPTLAVQLPTTQTDVLGARTETFDIRNTGNGKVKDVYFSIAYDPSDVVGGSVSHNGTLLTPVGTVPVGLPNAGKPIYKIPNANLANNAVVTITEKYTVNKCTAGRQNTYYAYWGSGIANSNDIFETSSNTRNISVSTGIPIIRHSDNSAFNYFKWQDGFCGNILGTYYVRFNNETSDPKGIAYNVGVSLFDGDLSIGFSIFEPVNIRLIASDGTEIPITATVGARDTREINFSNLTALSHTSLGSRDVGLTDEDGDGYRDDLKKGAYFQIAFDLKRKQAFQCLQPGKGPKNYFSLQPRAYVLYDNVCRGERDSSDLRLIDYGTMRIYFNGVNDASKLPAQLVENVSSAGYIAPGMNWPSLGIHQRTKNTTLADNERQFKYVITTPAGIKLQNVKLYRKTNIFGASPTTPINQPDIEAGTTVTITTSNTPADRDNTSGYLSFDALLQSCNGAAAPITYSVYLMVKNGDGTYCDIPLVCNQVTNIPTICSTPCAIQGLRMLSTKVERADNSYGWKDHTMTARQTRANVSSIERMRALYLDDIEFISEGQQHTGKTATNLFYYAKVENTAKLEPKKITLKVNGGAEQTFTATPNNPMRGTNAAGKNYFRWNLTSLLPAGTLPAGATFTAVATYQVNNNNPTNSNDRTMDIQSGIESFFYTLDNPTTDVTISTEGYHAAEKHCGANLTPIFYIAETQSMLATNEYKEFSGCNIVELGGNLIYAARRFKPGGTYFSQEFRPARLTKKITIKMPSAYRINNIKYTYTYKIAEAAKEATVDMNRLTLIDDGTWKTYTYINPPKGTTGHLPPGMITVVNDYNEYLKVFIQPSCKAKTVDGNKTYWDQGLDAKAMNEMVSSNIEYEDYYYHYAETGNSTIAIDKLNDRPILFAESKKPEITIDAISQLTVKANKRVMEATFKLKNIKEYDAPFGWISVPDVTGIEVISLEEAGYTYTAQNSISGEKMFFLSDKGNDGKILKNSERQFKLKYKITNCDAALQLKVYAGWNCNENPTTGYRNTCSPKFITYNIAIAKSKKEIAADPGNPGENDPNKKGSIPMCTATPYTYVINSADEGDIYNAKLVVTQGNGITISNVKVEYPLGGTVYTVGTGAGKIPHTQSGNRHTYDISNILPEGSLPGSLNEPNNANKRKFKLTFDVTPDCDFSAGSSFDIDVEGTNLCDSPAEGDKTRAIVAGIAGANVPDYGVQITMDKDLVGNLSSCGNSQKIEFTAAITHPNPLYQLNSTEARVHVRIPKGYELKSLEPKEPPVVLLPLGPDFSERKEDEEKVIGDEQELVFTIPKNMLVAPYSVGWILELQQKDDAKVPCDPSKIKAFASDRVTGITCNGQACPTLPRQITSTTVEKNLINQRPALSFTDLNITSAAKSGKEELTIKYKLSNAVTTTDHAADLPATQQVKIDLYKDTNNNGRFDAADTKLSTTPYTFQEAVVEGASSSEKTITALVDQGDVCRLLLVINNDTNKCLCKDVYTQLAPPATLTNLVPNLTVCEGETKQVAYGAASYETYTWSGKTTDDNITYLSATNVKEPNFHYTGTKLTTTKTFTYELKVKRTNGCEATQEVKITVQPAPGIANISTAPSPYCPGDTAEKLTVMATTYGVTGTLSYQWYRNTTDSNTGGTEVGTNSENYTPETGSSATFYYYVKVTNSTCGEVISNTIKVVVKPTPDQPTIAEATPATCTTISKAKITNVKPTTQVASYTFVNTETNRTVSATVDRTTGVISNLPVGKYKVTAIQEGCEKQSGEFEIEGFKAKPEQPKVSTEAQCDNPSKVEITNVKPNTEVTAYTFKNVETSAIVTATVDRTTGEVSALPVGKYKVTATNSDGCTQESDLFEIKAAKGHPDKPVLSTTESCNTLSLAKIENYQSSQSYTFVKADGTPLTGITVATNGVVNNLTIGTYRVKTTREGCDSDLSNPFVIKAKKAATAITTQPQGHNYPKNATAAAITVEATGEGNLRYKWFMNTTNSRTGADVREITTATTASYIPATRTVGSLFYWVEVTGDCGTEKSDIVEIKVTENIAPIEANDDTATVRRGQSVPVLPNDFAGGNPATLTNVTIAIDSNDGLTGATIDPQGRIKVPTNATPRTYNVVYKICLVSDPNTCKNATAKITVTNDPAYTIEANDDPLTRVAKGGTVNVLSNDQVNGNPATPTVVDVTIEDNGGLSNLEVNTATGKLKVPAGATSGTYEVTYRICVKGEASPCDTAKVKIEVTSDAAPTTTINANDDPNTSVAKGGLVEVLSNDRLNGEPVTKDKVTTTIDNNGGLTGVEIDPATGKIKVPVTATEGTYEVTYKICEKQNGTPCDTAKVKITVTSDVIHTIEANDDPEVTVGKGGTVTVLNNDTVDGTPATKDNVDISIDNNGGLTDLTTDPDGKIKVPANATPNTYEVTYRICVKGASSPCATAKVKITVTNDTSTTIIANDDPLTYVAKGGTADVLSNDRLGGDPATKDNVIVTIDSDGGLTGVMIDDATGKIKIPDNAIPGEYEVTYKICEKVNNSPCATAKIKLKVTDDPAATPTINANNDPDTRVRPGDKVEVLSNDRLNGAPATKDNVRLSIEDNGGLPGVTIDEATGKIQIPTDAPARTYEITYKICEKQNGTPCATAKVKVSVDNDTIRTIEANNDPLTRVAKGGTVDILSNDKVDGRPADKDKVNFSIENSGRLAGVTIEPATGKIKVPANATPGTYEVTYKICHKQQADLCDTATVTIEVVDAPAQTPTITANDDPLTRVPKGGTVDVLSNDRVNRDPATKDNVVPSIDNDGGLPGVTIDSNTGKIQIPTSATPGTYEVTYKICERQNGTPCATAKVKIEVTDDTTPTPTIIANDDPDTRVRPGGTVEVLSNDRLNGAPIQTGEVTIAIEDKGGLEGLTLTPAGKLKVPDTATPGSSYKVTYKICEKQNGTPCDRAKVKITIAGTARAIEAKDDNFGSIPNTADYTSTLTVFSAGVDTLEGVSGVLVPGTDVSLHPGTAPHANISMDPATGKISIKAGTPEGDYEYQYTICEKAEPTNCSNTATVRFKVVSKTIVANNDGLWRVGTKGGLTPSILNNDMLNGRTGLSEADVVIEATQGENNDVVHFRMNIDGRISVIPGLPVGEYTYHYTIKEKGNEGNIDKAQVRIKIVSFAAADDEFTEINNQDQPKTIEQSVLKNDELDGRTPLTTADVDITPRVFKDNNNNPVDYFTFDTTTGKITIKPHTPNGTYSFSYTICKKGTSECADPAQVTIKLEAVEAVDDYSATPVNTVGGAKIIGNVLDNDRYQGGPAIDHKDRVVVSRHSGDDRIEIKSTGEVIVPQGMPAGTYELTYQLCLKESSNTCDTAKITVVVFEDKPLKIHNGISADGDGHNDSFIIEGIELYPDNNLKIFNRWGVLVYEKDGYRNDTEPFDGHSNGRATINASSKLPQGTYYYILEYQDSVGQTQTNQGWLYLKY